MFIKQLKNVWSTNFANTSSYLANTQSNFHKAFSRTHLCPKQHNT